MIVLHEPENRKVTIRPFPRLFVDVARLYRLLMMQHYEQHDATSAHMNNSIRLQLIYIWPINWESETDSLTLEQGWPDHICTSIKGFKWHLIICGIFFFVVRIVENEEEEAENERKIKNKSNLRYLIITYPSFILKWLSLTHQPIRKVKSMI